MGKFKVVSTDMFQTLVDVNSRRHEVWKKILGSSYTPSFAEECWKEANKLVFMYFNKFVEEDNSFRTTKYIFENCYRELFPRKGVNFDPKNGAEILAGEHGNSHLYGDTEAFFNLIGKHYPICLVSDTDRDMIMPLIEKFNFDRIFLSEDFQCYKFDPRGIIFQEVIKHYRVDPRKIIHIGDGYSDVVGAKRAGMTACWLNRNGLKWNHEIKPDYTVSSLLEVAEILGVETGNIA